MKQAVFLDRDGVINAAAYNAEEGKYDSPSSLADFRFLPGAKQAIRLLNQKGWLTVVVSNQPGIAKSEMLSSLPGSVERANAAIAGGVRSPSGRRILLPSSPSVARLRAARNLTVSQATAGAPPDGRLRPPGRFNDVIYGW